MSWLESPSFEKDNLSMHGTYPVSRSGSHRNWACHQS
jgi:hypothetical protein